MNVGRFLMFFAIEPLFSLIEQLKLLTGFYRQVTINLYAMDSDDI
jgi:hypothetical protein